MSDPLTYYLRSTSIVFALVWLSGCTPPAKVAVEERAVLSSRQQSEDIGGQVVRIVQSGDTLYSIAFESNLDVNQLAAWNGISDVRDIPVGQRLRLTKPIGFVAKPVKQSELHKSPEPEIQPEPQKQPKPVAVQTPSQAPPLTPQTKTSQNNTTKPLASKTVAGVAWSWPIEGKVIRRFSASRTQQGVDIIGTNGQAVSASAPGQVVYAGNSLKGYGNLIIIEHNDDFLSAYAHNQKILVVEGQKIAANQRIGSVGINNRRESALHFQIRRKGQPVNPLNYLPSEVK